MTLPLPALPLLARWLVLVALTLLAGVIAFPSLAMRTQATAELRASTASARRRIVWLALLGTVVALVFELAVQLFNASLTNRYVILTIARAVALGIIATSFRRGRIDALFPLVVSVLLLLSQSLLSRSALEREWLLPVLADWLHLTFVALWLGGVTYLAAVLAPAALANRALVKGLGAAIEKFSPLAIMSVLIIALTGIVQSASFVGSFDALVNTAYGRALLVKLVLFAALIGFGAFHQFVISPQLNAWRARAESQTEAARRFRVSIAIETAIALLTLAAAAAMTVLPAARDAIAS